MQHLQLKALQAAAESLKTFDFHVMYSAISDALNSAGIAQDVSREVLSAYQKAKHQEYNKLNNAQCWIDAIIADLKTPTK